MKYEKEAKKASSRWKQVYELSSLDGAKDQQRKLSDVQLEEGRAT